MFVNYICEKQHFFPSVCFDGTVNVSLQKEIPKEYKSLRHQSQIQLRLMQNLELWNVDSILKTLYLQNSS